jgi:hypothetical protein
MHAWLVVGGHAAVVVGGHATIRFKANGAAACWAQPGPEGSSLRRFLLGWVDSDAPGGQQPAGQRRAERDGPPATVLTSIRRGLTSSRRHGWKLAWAGRRAAVLRASEGLADCRAGPAEAFAQEEHKCRSSEECLLRQLYEVDV